MKPLLGSMMADVWHQPASLIVHTPHMRLSDTSEALQLPQPIIAANVRLVLGVSVATLPPAHQSCTEISSCFLLNSHEICQNANHPLSKPGRNALILTCSMVAAIYALLNCPNELNLQRIGKEQLARHINGRNATEVPAKYWNENGFH